MNKIERPHEKFFILRFRDLRFFGGGIIEMKKTREKRGQPVVRWKKLEFSKNG